MDTTVQDLRSAVRTLRARPGLTLAAMVCAGLGIGLCTTIFSLVYAMLLRPFGFADPAGIVGVVGTNARLGVEREAISYADLVELRRQSTSFSQVAGYAESEMALAGGEGAELVQGAAVSADLFAMLGVRPIQGRLFTPEDDRQGAAGVMLLSHALWQRRFRSDPNVIGSWVRLDGVPQQIVGVMPPRFGFPVQQQVWVPLAPRLAGHGRGVREVDVLARLAPGVSLMQARHELAAIATRLAAQVPGAIAGGSLQALRLRDVFVSPGMAIMSLTLMGAASFVLLIACANVASLLLAWAAGRGREIAVRAAFGASPARIVRQLLSENLLLAVGGGVLGCVLAAAGVRALVTLFPASVQVPYWMVFSLNPPVLGFAAGAALVTGLLFGLTPAVQAAKTDLLVVLNEGGRGASGGRRRRRWQSALVAAEVSLSLVLLVGAALFVRSFFALEQVATGFDERPLLMVRTYLAGERYAGNGAQVRWLRATLQRVETLAGVEAAYGSRMVPLAGGGTAGSLEIAGRVFPKGQNPLIGWAGVTSGFFRTLGVPIVRGRSWTEAEDWEGQPVAVVNRTFAEHYFPGGLAEGHHFRITNADHPTWLTIVGVVRDFSSGAIDRPLRPWAYVPYPLSPSISNAVVVRARLAPGALAGSIRHELATIDPNVPVVEVATMREVRGAAMWQYLIVSKLFSMFGVLALGLATIGIYGVISYTVSQRRREIGTRIALGATRRGVVALIVRQGITLAAIGIAIGLGLALLLAHGLRSFFFGIGSGDPVSFGGLALLLLAIAALASYLPARRATRQNPTETLQGMR